MVSGVTIVATSDKTRYPMAFPFGAKRRRLSVGQAKTSTPELLLQDSILFAEVLDRGILLAADPPSGGDDEDLPWTNHACHGSMMNQSAAIG